MPALARRMSSDVAAIGAASAKMDTSLLAGMKPTAAEGVRALARRSLRLAPPASTPPSTSFSSHTLSSPLLPSSYLPPTS